MALLQRLVDRLSDVLEQPVLIDDAEFRPLAHSAHRLEQADNVRIDSIFGRSARPEVVHWLRSTGIVEAEQPTYIAGCDELGLTGRWCAPVRRQSALRGFVWVIADADLADEGVAELERCAQAAAYAIDEDDDRDRRCAEQGSLHALLRGPTPDRYAQAADLVSAGVVRIDQSVVALVGDPGGGAIDDNARVLAGLAGRRFARALGGRDVLHAAWDDHAVCLVAGDDRDALALRGAELGGLFRDQLAIAWDGRIEPSVGVGVVVDSIAAAASSYEQARWAARVAGRLPDSGPVTTWDDLGVFQLLRTIADCDESALPAGLRALRARPNGAMLLETLEVYLDTGGDAQETAARLYLARGSLYYRLRRIEEFAQVDLGDGRDRLTLHVGLKLARLTGYWVHGEPESARHEPRLTALVA